MVYIINRFDPRMVKRNLQSKILEFPSFEHFEKLFNKIIDKNQFQVNVQKDVFETFCILMDFDSNIIKPGPHLGSEDIEENDIAFYISPNRDTIFRYYFISITKPQPVQPIRKSCHDKRKKI